ncbi:hypothetical protein [Thermococcus sp. AM4]|uniref:hypothetical protein n=1 Tax=Thermococcus sp. (strain AM4) TaxID=246969 RepID=UPI00022997DC|nr:hypothetical protein [Thermococcus sp. AM4]EEB73169.2 conserved hypothetical protein [Thermococcus sp. AM4]
MPVHGGMEGLTLAGFSITVILVSALLSLLIAAFFMEMGAKLAGIENVTLGKSLIAILGGGILAMIVGAIFVFLPVINFILAFIAYLWVIKTVFNTGWLRAFVAWLLAVILAIVINAVILFAISAVL